MNVRHVAAVLSTPAPVVLTPAKVVLELSVDEAVVVMALTGNTIGKFGSGLYFALTNLFERNPELYSGSVTGPYTIDGKRYLVSRESGATRLEDVDAALGKAKSHC